MSLLHTDSSPSSTSGLCSNTPEMFLYNRMSSLIGSRQTDVESHIPCPIHSIPIEIIILIFEEYCRAWSSAEPTLAELRLTHVCKYWQSIAVDLSTLWTKLVITPHLPTNIVAMYLRRSQQLPLDLEVDLRHDSMNTTNCDHALNTWVTIKPTSSRWRRLIIHIGPQDATVISEDLRQLGAPLLEELSISSGSHVAGIMTTFEGGAPSLTSLRLSGLPLQRFSPSLHQLTRLDLNSNCPMQFSVFQRLMTGMVRLEELALHSRVVDGWPLYPSSEDIIHFPSLNVLDFSDRRWPLFIPLLSISAPVLHTLSLYDLVAHDLPETFTESHLHENFPAMRSLILKGQSSYIDDTCFEQLSRIFPAIDHFSLLDVDELFVQESSLVMHQTSIWPKLRTISMTPVVAEDILCSLISARTVPSTETSLKTLVVPVPTQFTKIGWISQQVTVEESSHTPTFPFSHRTEPADLFRLCSPSPSAELPF